jgi:hypothetical protein
VAVEKKPHQALFPADYDEIVEAAVLLFGDEEA